MDEGATFYLRTSSRGPAVWHTQCCLDTLGCEVCRRCLYMDADPLWCFQAVIAVLGQHGLADWVKNVKSYANGEYIDYASVMEICKKRQLKENEQC